MITIEYDNPIIDKCLCCGQQMVWLTRFVYKYGNIRALYCANFIRNHEDKVVFGLVSLVEWSINSPSNSRIAFPFKIWKKQDNFKVELTNKSASPWHKCTIFGQILNTNDALIHSLLKEVFEITHHMVRDDKVIMEYFY